MNTMYSEAEQSTGRVVFTLTANYSRINVIISCSTPSSAARQTRRPQRRAEMELGNFRQFTRADRISVEQSPTLAPGARRIRSVAAGCGIHLPHRRLARYARAAHQSIPESAMVYDLPKPDAWF